MSMLRKSLMALIIAVLLVGGMGVSATPAQAAGCAYYHTVRAGQSLSGIGRLYNVSWPYLAQINGIPAPRYRIYPGQVLCIAYGGSGGKNVYYPPNTNYPTNPAVTPWTFSIASVSKDDTVSIRTQNFPSNVLFKAKMGRRSGNGYEWKDLPDVDSGNGKSFEVVFDIPAEFQGTQQLVVRLIQAKKNGKVFHHDEWFNNIPGGYGTGGKGGNYPPYNPGYNPGPYGTIPTIWIASVVRDSSVTIRTANFPPNLDFQVLMGPMGTRGYGYHVASFNSGSGGAMTLTFSIPPQLYGSRQISIRTQNQWSGYHSYNWFYNNTAY